MAIYPDPATSPGSSVQKIGQVAHGVIVPATWFRNLPNLSKLPIAPNSTTRQGIPSAGSASPPASLSSIEARVPDSYFPAQIVKPLSLTPSVAGTVYNATPLSNITSIATDIRSGVRGRPLIPLGLRDRAADAMPPGIRQRAAVWSRAVARFRSKRPTSGGRIHRE